MRPAGDACRACGGTGEIWIGYPPRLRCWACGGTGAIDPRRGKGGRS